jgi:hypothetical protein
MCLREQGAKIRGKINAGSKALVNAITSSSQNHAAKPNICTAMPVTVR